MIIKRQKEFGGNLQDGFGGKSTDIRRTKNAAIRRSLSGLNRGNSWNVTTCEVAKDDIDNLDRYFTPSDLKRIKEIIKWIEYHPFSKDDNAFDQHPLWEFEDNSNIDPAVVWSAKINDKDRLNYLIMKATKQILIINVRGHFVINTGYSLDSGKDRP